MPAASMMWTRSDMGGAGSLFGALFAIEKLALKRNIQVVIPAVENSIDGSSYKLGDVYRAYDGTTVEVRDTDAEGRLILADALSYAVRKLKPTCLIDVATLTGSVCFALGNEMAGLYSNDDQLASLLQEAGKSSNEILWRLPLHESYVKKLKSSIADLSNVGDRDGGSIQAALFLRHFVKKVPWAHLDIAGTAFQSSEVGYWPKGAVGFGVRLLVNFFKKS